MADRAGIENPVVGQDQRDRGVELAEAAQHPILSHRLVVAGNPHRPEQLLGDIDLTAAVHALVFAMADDVALGLGAGNHLLHVAAAHLFQRRPGQDMDMPGLGVHRGRRPLGHLDDLLDGRPGHRLLLEPAHAFACLYQRLEFHSAFPPFCSAPHTEFSRGYPGIL